MTAQTGETVQAYHRARFDATRRHPLMAAARHQSGRK